MKKIIIKLYDTLESIKIHFKETKNSKINSSINLKTLLIISTKFLY